jgi:hypothetical protein
MVPVPITPTWSCAMPVGLSLPQRSSPCLGPSLARVAVPITRSSAVVPEKMMAGSANTSSDGGNAAAIALAAIIGALACCVVNAVTPTTASFICTSSCIASAVDAHRAAPSSSNAPAFASGCPSAAINFEVTNAA